MSSDPSTVESAAAATDSQTETNAGVARATGVLALGNITSRVLGLVRETVLSTLFGASATLDAFYIAINIPKALYDLLIAGHINGAIIPVLSEIVLKDGRAALWRLVSVLISLVTAIMALLVLFLEVLAPQIVSLVGSGYDQPTLQLAADLLRLTAPALLFLGWFSVLSGTLYALKIFTWPAFAGAGFNAAIVLATVFLVSPLEVSIVFNARSVQWTLARPPYAITAAAIGWLLGSLVQVVLQLPGLRDARIHLTINWKHPAIRQIIRLYTPVMFSLILDTLVIRLFSYNLASRSIEGSLSYMNRATTLIQFPQGLVATAISIAILPTLARQAVLTTQEGLAAFRNTLGLGLRLAITMILPATLGLFVLASPIVTLLFEHGLFTATDTAITVTALRLYLLGLPFAALDLLLVYAFYAHQDTLTPALIGLLSLGVYMVVAVVLFPTYGLFSLMIADSIKHLIHALISTYLLARRLKGLGRQRLVLTFLKAGIAALVMAGTAAITLPIMYESIGTQSLLQETVLVLFIGGMSMVIYLGIAGLLRIEELRWLWHLVRQRLRPV